MTDPTATSVPTERGSAPATAAFHCPECGKTWTTDDDANEWAYGHDCEAEVKA